MNISSPSSADTRLKKVLFMSDLDGTWLSKNPENRARLDREIFEIKDEYREKGVDLSLGYITARPPQRVEKEALPTPDWTVTYNGAEIHAGDPGNFDANGAFTSHPSSQEWVKLNAETGFSAETALGSARALLSEERFSNLNAKTVGEVVDNAAADANQFTTALCFNVGEVRLSEAESADRNGNSLADIYERETFAVPAQLRELVGALDESLDAQGVGHEISPVYIFHGKPIIMFDVASPIANKGEALSFLQHNEQVSPSHTIVAGDGGNDISMMTGRNGGDEGRRVIVVGGDSKLVDAASGLRNSIIQPASMDCSLGVIGGLRQHLDAIVSEG